MASMGGQKIFVENRLLRQGTAGHRAVTVPAGLAPLPRRRANAALSLIVGLTVVGAACASYKGREGKQGEDRSG
jgi:hypothetical protein